MPNIRTFTKSGRTTGTFFALLVLGFNLAGTPILAQTDADRTPPWQLPPGGRAAQSQETTVTRTAFNPASENSRTGGEHQTSAAPKNAPQNNSPSGSATSNHNEGGDYEPWAEGEDASCDYGRCLNPISDRLWVRAEALAMFVKSPSVPPLATTSTAGTARAQAGVLGFTTTGTLFGNENEDFGVFPGARFTLGYRCKPCSESGLETVYMFLGNKTATFSADNTGTPIIARPFFNAQTSAQDSLIVAYPDQQTGNINIGLSDEFHTLEMYWRQAMFMETGRQVDFLAGYRYGHFAEALNVNSTSTFIRQVGNIPVGTISQVSDRFAAVNDFQGGEVGFSTKFQRCRWSFDLLGKVGLGNTRSTITTSGSSSITSPPSAAVTSNSGMLVLPTNTVNVIENNLTVIPEFGATIGYDLSDRMKISLGYSFLYWSRVARPTDQVDLNINTSQFSSGTLSGFPAPQFRYIPGDYWVQGFNLGLDYRF